MNRIQNGQTSSNKSLDKNVLGAQQAQPRSFFQDENIQDDHAM